MNNLSPYCGLVDAKIRASDKDLPVTTKDIYHPPHITVCETFQFRMWFEQKHGFCANFDPYSDFHYNFTSRVKNCLQSSQNSGKVVNDLLEYSLDPIRLPDPALISKDGKIGLGKSAWKRVFHQDYGVCYTLDAKLWTRYILISIQKYSTWESVLYELIVRPVTHLVLTMNQMLTGPGT